jgi:hypothetical protein
MPALTWNTANRSLQPSALDSDAVSAEQVALIPKCAECGEVWLPTDEDRWQAHLDTEDELVFF